jgi:menaquinone-dependent protoporphyrinogen oxidase
MTEQAAVLVGYASAHGSTREIAERIGAVIARHGIRTEVRSMNAVDDSHRYRVFVLGSAVHNQAWLAEATDFVHGNSELLAGRPVWAFSVGTPAALRGPWRRVTEQEEARIMAGLPATVPLRGHRLLSGVIRRDQLPIAGRVMFRLMGCHYGDFRDWAEIDAWADGIARELAEG